MIEPISAYGWCIVQVTLLAAVAGGVYLVARRLRAGGNVSLLAATLAAVALVTVLSLSPWPRWSWQPGWLPPSPADNSLADAPAVETYPVVAATPRVEEPGPARRPHDVGAATPAQSTPQPALAAPDCDDVATGWPWLTIVVVAAWLLGGVGLVRFVLGLVHLHRCRRRSLPIADAALQTTREELRASLSIAERIGLRESPEASVPATIGWRRPLILLPCGWQEWSADERRAVLAHELAHVAGRHFQAWLVGQLALAAHLYHPLVHWLARRLRLELELSADRVAAVAFGDRQRYAAVLAGIALAGRPGAGFSGVGLLMTRPLLMRRMAMLQQPDRSPSPRPWSRRWAVLLVLGTAIAVVGLRGGPAVTAVAADSAPPAGAAANPIAELPDTSAIDSPPATKGSHVVTALLQVSRQSPGVAGSDQQPMSDAAWATFCNTQAALLKSDFMLRAAIRDPKIASLPLLQAEDDPVAWLRSRLEVGFRPSSEILAVQMHGAENQVTQLKQLVDSVVKAYLNEVVYSQRRRTVEQRDVLARALDSLKKELNRKSQMAHDLAIELGSAAHGGVGQVQLQVALKRLDRIETELMKLENEQLAAQLKVEETADATTAMKTKLKFYEQRIAQLRKRQDELEQQIRASSETSVDLQERLHEVEQLQRIADDMTLRLESMDIEKEGMPDRIRLIQPATASRDGADTAAAQTPTE